MHRRAAVVLKALCLGLIVFLAPQVYHYAVQKPPLADLYEEIALQESAAAPAEDEAESPPEGDTAPPKEGEGTAPPPEGEAGTTPPSKDETAEAPPPEDEAGKAPPPKEDSGKAAPKGARRPSGPPHARGRRGPPKKGTPLPEKYGVIDASGVFGRPPPKQQPPPALIGLVGDYAILRAPDGKTDLVPEGGELSGITVVRIGINRVLITYEGKEQELTVFSGMGSSPLLSPAKKGKE